MIILDNKEFFNGRSSLDIQIAQQNMTSKATWKNAALNKKFINKVNLGLAWSNK